MSVSVREIEVPADAVALSTLAGVNYTDAFCVELPAGPARSGEEWARETFEGAPTRTGAWLRCGWRLLGLRLAPSGGAGTILGWRLRHGDADFALIALDSWIGLSGELLFRPDPGGLLFATLAERKNPAARAIWAPIAPLHRRIIPALLRRAAARSAAWPPVSRRRGGRRPSRRRRASPRCCARRGRG